MRFIHLHREEKSNPVLHEEEVARSANAGFNRSFDSCGVVKRSPNQRGSPRKSARAFWASASPSWRAMNSSSASAVPFRRASSYSSAIAMDGSRGGGRLGARAPLAISIALAFPVIMRGCTSTICNQLSSPARAVSGTAVLSLINKSPAVSP